MSESDPERESRMKPTSAPVQRRRSSSAARRPSRPLPGWVDGLVLLVALVIATISVVWTIHSGAFNVSLTDDQLWSWHLVRACGLIAYALLAASTLWGVFLSSRVIKDWSPGALSLLLHATTSWLAVVFALAHVGLLLFDSYYHFTIPDLLIPFGGPYRPIPVGFGVIGMWLIFAITISFSMRKLIGQRAWQYLHYASYASFGLISVHALLAGTDGVQPGLQLILVVFALVVFGLMGMRIAQSLKRRTAHA